MLRDITLGQYYPGDSVLHNSDPRTKIVLSFVYMVTVFLIKSYFGFLSILLFTLLAITISKIPLKFTLRGLKPLLLIIIFAAFVNIFTVPGRAIVEIGFLKITYEGLDTAIKMSLRLIFLISGASLLTLTTTPIRLTDGIEKLLKPFERIGIPAHEIAMMMTIALRFIPTLMEETDKIIKAQSSRGADFESGRLIDRAKSYIPVLVPLFISAFRRADELATAMEARCYRGGEGRTRMKQLKYTRNDALISAFMIAFSIWIIVSEYLLY